MDTYFRAQLQNQTCFETIEALWWLKYFFPKKYISSIPIKVKIAKKLFKHVLESY